MKTLSLLFILSFSFGWSQSGEFVPSQNGLIYSDTAVNQLKHIVDSLNLKFRTCDNKPYYTKLQGKGTYFSIEGPNAGKAKMEIESGISPKKLKKKYPEAQLDPDLLVVKHRYKDYAAKDVVLLENVGLNDKEYELSLQVSKDKEMGAKNKGWVFIYREKSEYSNESLEAFYLDGLKSVKLKENYSRLVQYSDCLIDTTATVYLAGAAKSGVRYSYTEGKIREMLNYIDKKLDKPIFIRENSTITAVDTSAVLVLADTTAVDTTAYVVDNLDHKKYREFSERLEEWEKVRLKRVDLLMKTDKELQDLFVAALRYAKEGKEVTDDEFEEYVARYISRDTALELKRNRRVIGGCSMDSSPRIHAMNIAELAAETAKWEIFLRSHLDIMNDRFDRVSDASYAYEGRKTYIKELEVLDINVNDLLLGISLRVGNPSENHYFGSIGRIGRSLSEAQDKENIEKVILNMIADKNLDDYNRVLMYWLFENYNRNLDNKNVVAANNIRLKQAISYMPDYLSKKASIEKSHP